MLCRECVKTKGKCSWTSDAAMKRDHSNRKNTAHNSGRNDALYSQVVFAAAAVALGLDSCCGRCSKSVAHQSLVLLFLLLSQRALQYGLRASALRCLDSNVFGVCSSVKYAMVAPFGPR
jgi:hypothetical protein